MITENERDRRTAAWLIETYGAEAVAEQPEGNRIAAREALSEQYRQSIGG
ncbi:protein A [Neisseria gonorrhoeae]|nr:protein A [Neisseria gonorrhoeae]